MNVSKVFYVKQCIVNYCNISEQGMALFPGASKTGTTNRIVNYEITQVGSKQMHPGKQNRKNLPIEYRQRVLSFDL
jgi:hypothetical protein